MIDMRMRADDCVDIRRFDPGFGNALLQAAGGGPEQFRCAHAGVEHDELVIHVHDRHVLFEDDIAGRQEIVRQHFLHVFLRHADKGARGIAER